MTKLRKCSVPKQGQDGRINIICRPSGRSMTAATALMDFPFSRQQHTNSNTKNSINYCPDILQLFNWYLNIHVLMPMLLSMLCLCCLLEIKDSWFLIPDIWPVTREMFPFDGVIMIIKKAVHSQIGHLNGTCCGSYLSDYPRFYVVYLMQT